MKEVIAVKYSKKNEVLGISYNDSIGTEGVLKKKGKVSYVTFPVLEELPFIKHGFSTREGGESKGYLGSMNLSYSRGDDPETVDYNFKTICDVLKIDTENLVLSDQVHETKVHVATKEDCQGENLRERKLKGIDGLITNEKKVALCTSYADCVPLYMVDKEKRAIGHSHSGWRGTVGKIGKKTIEKMEEQFGTKAEDVIAVIGPSICQNCYEVSQDVKNAFEGFVNADLIVEQQHMSKEYVEKMIDAVFREKENNKYDLDLWLANQLIFMEAGVKKENISVSCMCTCCNSEIFYSHRASCGKRGNLAGFLVLEE